MIMKMMIMIIGAILVIKVGAKVGVQSVVVRRNEGDMGKVVVEGRRRRVVGKKAVAAGMAAVGMGTRETIMVSEMRGVMNTRIENTKNVKNGGTKHWKMTMG